MGLATWTKGEGNSPESFFENEFILENKYTVCVGLRRLRRTEGRVITQNSNTALTRALNLTLNRSSAGWVLVKIKGLFVLLIVWVWKGNQGGRQDGPMGYGRGWWLVYQKTKGQCVETGRWMREK